jgi:hypothetical protein
MTQRCLLGALSLTALLSGCSGTPFGDQLARSFSDPPAASPARPAPAPDTVPAKPKVEPKIEPKPAAKSAPAAKPGPVAAPSKPAPYRVTIKLPAADPSAPAEVVTQALRAAGLSFEVESIERVSNGGDASAAPTRTAAPAPR